MKALTLIALLVSVATSAQAQAYTPWVHPTYQGAGFKARMPVKGFQAVEASPVQVLATDTTKRFIDVWYNPRWTSNSGQYVRVVGTAAQFNDPAGLNRKVLGDSNGLGCSNDLQSPNTYVAIFGIMWPLTTPATVPANGWSDGGYTVEWRISPVDSIMSIGYECPSL